MSKEWTEETVREHIFTEVLVSDVENSPLDKWERKKLMSLKKGSHYPFVTVSTSYRYMQPIPKTKTKTIPMGTTTCPSFPWAIMGPYWDEGSYLVVIAVDITGVTSGREFISWKRLHEEGWLDYETGKPLSVEIDVSVKGEGQ